MGTHEVKKSYNLFRRMTAGVMSAIIFSSSVMANFMRFEVNNLLTANGAEYVADKTISASQFKDLEYEIELKENGQWKVTFSGSTNIPANITDADEFKAYKDNIDEIIIKSDITGIAAHAFEGMAGLNTVYFERNTNIKEIGEAAFKNCTYLASINLENCKNLETLGSKESRDGVFENSALTTIKIPASLQTIGNDSFFKCNNLVTVNFEENDKLNYFGIESFARCEALESINLENCKASKITFARAGNDTAAFYQCSSLKSVTVPSGASENISYLFYRSSSLSSITFEDNENYIYDITNIVAYTAVDVLDLTPLKNIPEIGNWQIRGNMTKVIIPGSVKRFGKNIMADVTTLHIVEFKSNDYIEVIPETCFQNDRSLISVNLDALNKLTTLGNQAFENCASLSTIEIPSGVTEMGDYLFHNCVGIINFYFNAAKLQKVGNGIFDGTAKFDFTIGKDVKNIPIDFLLQAQDHISRYKFEQPIPFFTVGTEGQETGLNAPFNIGGTFSADANGNIYKIEKGSAKLIYANKEIDKMIIPDTVQGYDVTCIAKYAFKNCILNSLTIENPKGITVLEDYAFAKATLLENINGCKYVDDIRALFTGSEIGNNIFYNTRIAVASGITDEVVFDTNAEKQSHDNRIVIMKENVESLNFAITNRKQEISQEDDPERAGMFWTGLVANVGIGGEGGLPVRMYIRCEEGCEKKLDNTDIEIKPTDIDGIYYFDISHINSAIGITTISLSYPNFSAPGSKVQIWGMEFESETAYQDFIATKGSSVVYPASGNEKGSYVVTDEYFEIEWTTKPNTFDLTKTYASDALPEFILSSDRKATLSNLAYDITFSKSNNDTAGNIGSDLVRYVDYTDVLTLPAGLQWRDGISNNIGNTHFIMKSVDGTKYEDTLYVEIGGVDYELCTVSGFSNIVDMYIEKIGDTYQLHWRVINPSSEEEIPPISNGRITFGPEILVADSTIQPGDDIKNIKNNISTEEYFTYSDMQTSEAEAIIDTFTVPESKLILNKEKLNDLTRMGEDVRYKITVENRSAFGYEYLDYIEDNFVSDTIHYIKPQNMQLLFDNEVNGKYLTITISNAVLAIPLAATQDGAGTIVNTPVGISPQDTANENDLVYNGIADEDNSIAYEKVTVTLSKDGSNIRINYSGTVIGTSTETKGSILVGAGLKYTDIASALDSIGYIVTNSDIYALKWSYPSDFVLEGGTTWEFIIDASIKDSLMYLPKGDLPYYYGYPGSINLKSWNSVTLHNTKDSTALESNTYDNSSVTHDLKLGKGATINGAIFDENYPLKDNEVIDYFIKIEHFGSGSYDVLPVVDHMTGIQAMIVSQNENENSDWIDYAETYTDVDGTEYYVLNAKGVQSYTYNGVYANGFYVDSVTVKKTDGGLDTVIKYYIKDTPGRTFNLSVTYKAISSQAFAGNSNTQISYYVSNEAWLNDRPGHRLYDTIRGGGSAVDFDKSIVTEKHKTDPKKDELDEDDACPINQSTHFMTYRLDLHNTGSKYIDSNGVTKISPTIELTGEDMFDMLPLTGEAFDWEKNVNISLSYVIGDAGYDEKGNSAYGAFSYNGNTLKGDSDGAEWEITYTSPSTVNTSDDADQQYIKWDDNFVVYLPADAWVYIYVTLEFPGLNDTETWTKFITEKGSGNPLVNTFYVYDLPASVTHNLSDSAIAFLQKGVYETGSYILNNYGDLRSYEIGADRWHYSNNPLLDNYLNRHNGDYTGAKIFSKTMNTVTYYVVIRNSGRVNLYLAPIYDILPEGYRYMALRTGNGNNPNSAYHVGNTNIDSSPGGCVNRAPVQHGGYDAVMAMAVTYSPSEYLKNIVANDTYVKCTNQSLTDDGRQILRFEFESPGSKNENDLVLSKDDYGNYYLKPGQFIQFGYTVFTGNSDITEAVNNVAMPYYDPNITGEEAVLDEETKVAVSTYNGKSNNDGDRYLWNSDEADKYGFTDDLEGKINTSDPQNNLFLQWLTENNPDLQWFASSVAVTRDNPSPGINKTVDNSMVRAGDPVNWTITANNNGASAITKYTITDTVEAPLKFEGDVCYKLCSSKGDYYAMASSNTNLPEVNSYLFHINRDGDKVTIRSNISQKDEPITFGGDPVTLDVGIICSSEPTVNSQPTTIKVQFKYDKNNNEVLIIDFDDVRLDIIPNGYGELKLLTSSATDISPNTYKNNALFSPRDNSYDSVTQGKIKTDENTNEVLGVEWDAYVNIYSGSPSASIKMIEEKENPSNNTTSEKAKNYIVLADDTKVFTYTLEVTNRSTTESDVMENLVVIDNLPEVGDNMTMKNNSERDSAFKVSLLTPNPNVAVYMSDSTGQNFTELDDSKYVVEFCNKNGKNDTDNSFVEDDWNGANPDNNWYDISKISESTRSIRVCLINGTNIPSGASVRIKFDAIINDKNAKPGQIAWNSFGYSYNVGSLNAKAAPAKVGVCIPGVPTIKKQVVDSAGNKLNVSENVTFNFVIYNGNAIDFSDYSAATVGKTLTDKNIPFMYADLEVEAGTSSNQEYLYEFQPYTYANGAFTPSGKPTTWNVNAKYTIVELETDTDYTFKSINNLGNNNYSFTFNNDGNVLLTVVNEMGLWNIKLTKTDQYRQPLEGALFGIYTSDKSKEMDNSKFNALNIEQSLKTITEGEVVYYIMDAKISPATGVIDWNDLDEDIYVVFELKAPDGYRSNGKHYVIKQSDITATTNLYEFIVENIAIVNLPDAGGTDIMLFIEMLGLLLICSVAVFLGLRYKRRYA